MKKFFRILGVVFVLSVFTMMALGSSSSDSSGEGSGGSSVTKSSAKESAVYGVGDTVKTEKAEITLVNVEQVPTEASWYEFGTVKEGNIVYKATFAYKNTTNTDIYISESDFKLYADNQVCETVWLLDSSINENIGAEREATMEYTYAVPEGAKELEFEYEGTFGMGSFKDITYKVTIEDSEG
ncbi:MAG: DUF4352 domain-containing protein [Clostridia bacterium]|nr:DUF4352 domain-containing protein [Clostridia bacterium]